MSGVAYKYKSCYMTDLATKAGVDVSTFQDWITGDDWKALIDLGWRPNKRILSPSVVKYIMDKIVPDYEKANA
ncbi:hypothetical protein GCM10028817_38900 [Spirosoma pomorum]